ncbi:hypothetical protein E1A91_A05G368700v1 [Gossypium mustelinum]|uniref:Transcriptional regulator ATRX homolog n=1 Tax=Gossypium mustelinum TaxID=34275 RepID=A0A5D2ZI26_GOSMU|nr:hypothetical protein E1A91_A05G368700v1 [Gossypium mustelinum]
MPSEDSKSVKKEEPEEDNEDLKSLSSMGENRKKKPSSNSNNAAISNSKLRPKEAKVKKEEPVETDDEDEKPISKRSSATKATKPKKEESDDEDEKPISKRSSATKADKEKEMKKKKKKGEEKKAAAGKEVKREKKVYDLPGQKRDPPEERDPLRIFYETMYQQIPHSEMAQFCEYTPRLIKKLEGIRVKRVAAGLLHSTCIDETGSLFVFGDKVVANLGFGEAKNATMPSMINTLPYSEEVACGGYHTCVVTSDRDSV